MFKNANGKNRIIRAGENCLVPTSKCFWKDPCDVAKYGVKTKSCTKNKPTIDYKDFDDYTLKKENGSVDEYLEKNKKIIDFIFLFNLRCYTNC